MHAGSWKFWVGLSMAVIKRPSLTESLGRKNCGGTILNIMLRVSKREDEIYVKTRYEGRISD